MTSVTLKPSKRTFAHSCPCAEDAEGNRESHSSDCYRWEISPAYWTKRGWKWKSCCAAVQKSGTRGAALPTSPGAACRDVSVQEQSVFPRLSDPSPWLAGIKEPTPVFRGSWQTGMGNTRCFLLPGLCAASRAEAEMVNVCRLRSSEWWQELCLSQEVPHPISCQGMPRDAISSEGVGRRVKVCGTALWRYHRCHELMHSHCRVPWEPGETEGIRTVSQELVCSSCVPGFAWPFSLSVRPITGY